jgi:hypothetical protein
MSLIQWLKETALPCQVKSTTGVSCPGCGFQRSVIALLEGDLWTSIQHYPALIPLILTFFLALLTAIYNKPKMHQWLLRLTILDAALLIGAWLSKLMGELC